MIAPGSDRFEPRHCNLKCDSRKIKFALERCGRKECCGVSWSGAGQGARARLILQRADVRRGWIFHADDVVAGVDMVHFNGHAAQHTGKKKELSVASRIE